MSWEVKTTVQFCEFTGGSRECHGQVKNWILWPTIMALITPSFFGLEWHSLKWPLSEKLEDRINAES